MRDNGPLASPSSQWCDSEPAGSVRARRAACRCRFLPRPIGGFVSTIPPMKTSPVVRCDSTREGLAVRNRTLATIAAATGLVLVTPPALADPPPQARVPVVEQAYVSWIAALETSDCDGSLVSRLYTRNAILLATFTKYIQGRPDITDYFDGLTCNPDLTVATNRIRTGRDGGMGYATGLYRFTYTNESGGTVKVPARFTFVFVKRGGDWLIATHHSSEDPKKK